MIINTQNIELTDADYTEDVNDTGQTCAEHASGDGNADQKRQTCESRDNPEFFLFFPASR
jgi:hypothetical protein